MKEGGESDKDPGTAALTHKTGGADLGISLGAHLGASRHLAGGHHHRHHHLGGGGGLAGFPGLHHPLQLAALSSQQQAAAAAGILYPSLLGANLNPATLMASLAAARSSHQFLGQPPSGPPPGMAPTTTTLASLHATLAAADTSRQRDLLATMAAADSARQRDLLATLSKLATTSANTYLPHHDSPVKPDSSAMDSGRHGSPMSPASFSSSSGLGGSPSLAPPITHPNLVCANMAASITTGGLGSETPSPTAGSSPPGSNGRLDLYMSTTPTRKSSNGRPDRIFTCKICNRSFGYKHVLQNHERTHTGEKPFECKECHKRFTRDHHLKTHMRLHTGEKPYHCTHCDRQFVQVANLRRHLRVHTGERPYSCELCSSRFSDSNQLKAHMLIHKGEKPFECGRCSGRYRRRHHLMHHKCPNDPENDRRLDTIQYSESDTYSLGPEDDDDDEFNEEDLPPPATLLDDEPLQLEKRRERKSRDPRRVISHPMNEVMNSVRLVGTAHLLRGLHSALPEQTEPEDLSVAGTRGRNRNYSGMSAVSSVSGFPVNELDYSRDSLSATREDDASEGVGDCRFPRQCEDEEPMSSQT